MFGDLTRVAAKQVGSDNQLKTKPVSQTSGQFQHMFVTYFAAHVLKCTDTYVQAQNTFFVIMVILWNGCNFLYIAFTRLLVYLNWVNLLCRSVWPHCPYMVQCNTVYWCAITSNRKPWLWLLLHDLTHWSRDKNGSHFPDENLNGFSWMKIYEFRLKFVPRTQYYY